MKTYGVILAGGNGSRLAGIVPTGMKPLLVVNGQTLIARLVDQLRQQHVAGIVIVVSPTNAAPIVDLLGSRYDITFIVQPTPRGPGDALWRACEILPRDASMVVLMGDNYLADDAVGRVMAVDAGVTVGVTPIVGDASRFTRVWFDPPTILHSYEGPQPTSSHAAAWCGPLRLPIERTHTILGDAIAESALIQSGEVKIGPSIELIAARCTAAVVTVNAQDIGIPEALGG